MPDTPIEAAPEGSYPAGMEARVAVLEYITGRLDNRFDAFERRFGAVERRLDSLEHRFDGLERRFDGLEHRFDSLERRFEAMAREHRTEFRWLLGIMLAGFGGLLGVIAHGFHWL